MAIGKHDQGDKALEVEGDGDSAGIPAAGELEGNAYHPLGERGEHHWQASYITKPGLEERGSVFFAAVEMTRMPMVVTDPNQNDNPIVFVNRAFLDLTYYTEEQVLGRNCRFLQGEQTDPETIDEVRTAVREHRAVAVDILNYKADGTPFWNALFIGPIFDADGKLLYYFASQVDITRRRASEQTFRQAQKMEAIGQLTAGLAHDFNNLLQVITGNLEMVEQRVSKDPIALQAINFAQRSAEKGAKLTQQLLAFARKQRLEPKRLNLNTLVVEFSEMLVRTLGEKVDLRLDLKPGLPHCTLDPTHLEMALLNVLINARDAMPLGGKITIGTSTIYDRDRTDAHHLPGGAYVVLCVIDEGIGMSQDVLRRATEPFFTTKGPGTGLGLAMVHGFVQQSHGRLELASEPGNGTTVRMIFPIAVERSIPPTPAEELPENPPDEHAPPQTVLLVDDSEDVRQVTDSYLRSQGYRVIATHSGEAALQILDGGEHKIDMLFTDVIMPGGMNGLVLANKVRERFPDMPVLLATGYTDELDGQGINTASYVVLNKPYRRTEMLDRIRVALNSVAGGQNAPANFRHEG